MNTDMYFSIATLCNLQFITEISIHLQRYKSSSEATTCTPGPRPMTDTQHSTLNVFE